MSKAALYELLAKTFLFTQRDIVEALVSGSYSEALVELLDVNGMQASFDNEALSVLNCYQQQDKDEVFHNLRKEYTRVYIGVRDPIIYPFAGAWDAVEKGQKPLLFVGKKSMAIERFMRKCGVVQAEGTNEPLDHVGSMLEFLMYLNMVSVGQISAPEGIEIPSSAYEDFYSEHFIGFAQKFAAATIEQSGEEFFKVGALVLNALPVDPL